MLHIHSKTEGEDDVLFFSLPWLKLRRRNSSASAEFVAAALKTYDTYEGKGVTTIYNKLAGSVLGLPSYFGDDLRAHVERTCGGTDRAAIARYMGEQATEGEYQKTIFMVSYV